MTDKQTHYVTFYLPDDTSAKLSLLVLNPLTGKARHGLKSKITATLLDKFFEAYGEGRTTLDVRDLLTQITNT